MKSIVRTVVFVALLAPFAGQSARAELAIENWTGQSEPAKPTAPANVAGKWNAVLELESVTGHPVLTFKQDGEKLSGTYQGRYGESPLEGTIKEKKIEFRLTINAEGMQSHGVFIGTVEGDTMKGQVAFEGGGEGTWSAERAKS